MSLSKVEAVKNLNDPRLKNNGLVQPPGVNSGHRKRVRQQCLAPSGATHLSDTPHGTLEASAQVVVILCIFLYV